LQAIQPSAPPLLTKALVRASPLAISKASSRAPQPQQTEDSREAYSILSHLTWLIILDNFPYPLHESSIALTLGSTIALRFATEKFSNNEEFSSVCMRRVDEKVLQHGILQSKLEEPAKAKDRTASSLHCGL